MNPGPPFEWLEKQIWPQIHTMMYNDACFKLIGEARKLTGQFNDVIAWLLEVGYLSFQMLAIRRLCDDRTDVISLRRALRETKSKRLATPDRIDPLLTRLDSCDRVRQLVNDYLAHTANSLRRPDVSDWNLRVGDLIEAQKAICQVAITLDRDLLGRKSPGKIIITPQLDVMQDFKFWVPDVAMKTLREFWHGHNKTVNAWIVS